MKGVDYQQEAFEKKFSWLNHRLAEEDGTGKERYSSHLTQLAWESWCAALELAFKQQRELNKKKVAK